MKKFFIAILLVSTFSVTAAQLAIVQNSKAVIYSDIELKSPIGFVRKGKQLAVGQVKRRRGEILPVVVNGRVAWIRVADLILPNSIKTFDQDRKVTEHEVLIEENAKDPLNQNNYVTLRTGPSSLSVSSTNNVLGEADDDLNSAAETSLMFEHKNPYRYFHWGFGFDYFAGEIGLYNFKTLNLKGGFSWVPIRTNIFSVEAYGNVLLSGDFRVTSQDIGEYKGNMYGLDYGAAVRLFPESRFGLILGAGITQYRLSGLNDIQNSDNDEIVEVTSFNGSKIFAGLTLRFQ